MILDPVKTDFAKLLFLLKRVSAVSGRGVKGDARRDWAADTAKTLKAGKLEDFDLAEFVAVTFEEDLAACQNHALLWDYGQALLALIEEMERLGLASPRIAAARGALRDWRR